MMILGEMDAEKQGQVLGTVVIIGAFLFYMISRFVGGNRIEK